MFVRSDKIMKKIVTILVSVILLFTCNLSYKLSKTEWTVPEVKSWVNENKDFSTWKGLILYQGTDTVHHHYIGRIMDKWVWFNIAKEEIVVKDERPFNNTSGAELGYYYVDPNKDFEKVKEYSVTN